MPKFLEQKLKQEYGNNPAAIYGTMNKIGAMHGNKETAKGKAMAKKHAKDMKGGKKKGKKKGKFMAKKSGGPAKNIKQQLMAAQDGKM